VPPREEDCVMKRAVIYARFSSENQREASIEDQVRNAKRLIEERGWQLVHTYLDRAISGASPLRPGYQALMAEAREGRFDVVVAEGLDRLSRSRPAWRACLSCCSSTALRSSPAPRGRSASSMSVSRER
jgi:DNA invertase Pin-like site-specific DNA recombinase